MKKALIGLIILIILSAAGGSLAACGKSGDGKAAFTGVSLQPTVADTQIPPTATPERVIINMGVDYNDLNTAVPMPGEIKYSAKFKELTRNPDNADALFAVDVKIFPYDELDWRDEASRLADIGFDLKFDPDSSDIRHYGLVPGKVLRDFQAAANCGYEIIWDTRDDAMPQETPET
jgi:hypothetical protein